MPATDSNAQVCRLPDCARRSYRPSNSVPPAMSRTPPATKLSSNKAANSANASCVQAMSQAYNSSK